MTKLNTLMTAATLVVISTAPALATDIAVPEPGSLSLWAIGAAAVWGMRRLQSRK